MLYKSSLINKLWSLFDERKYSEEKNEEDVTLIHKTVGDTVLENE